MKLVDRRTVMAGGVALLGTSVKGAAQAQAKPKLRLSVAFPETDLRAEGYKAFAAAMKDEFDLEPYWSNTLFKQGTELVALQRENLPRLGVHLCGARREPFDTGVAYAREERDRTDLGRGHGNVHIRTAPRCQQSVHREGTTARTSGRTSDSVQASATRPRPEAVRRPARLQSPRAPLRARS